MRISVVSFALPHLKAGAVLSWENILESFNEDVGAIKNRTENTYQVGKCLVEFFGVESNEARTHGPRRNILFVNEANRKITYEIYDQLATRTQGTVFLDFNPDQEFWVHNKLIPNFPHVFIKSNYNDNPFLPTAERMNIESKKDLPGFENWWRVYGMGELGRFEGLVFPNWQYGAFDRSEGTLCGLDIGYNPDPDALVRVSINRKTKMIYCDELVYGTKHSPEQLIELIDPHVSRDELIICDTNEERLSAALQKRYNIRRVNKHRWSVEQSIKLMQDYTIVVTERSSHLSHELNNYIWSDKRAGLPVKAFDHCIDAVRYCFMESVDKTRRQYITRIN
jgi:phage terminase large subunit